MQSGDKVRVKNNCSNSGRMGYIVSSYYYNEPAWNVLLEGDSSATAITESNLILIDKKMSQMNIKEKFTLAFKSEPEKSFRKTGITNGDDFLTDDGQKVFLSWLLKKNGADFNTEVVQDLLKDIEKEESK